MLNAIGVTVRFGKRVLFEDVNIKFNKGNCYGIIGANGAGKSTFLKVLSGELEPSKGEVVLDKGERLSILKQDHFAYEDFRVLDTVIMGNHELYKIMKDKEALYSKPDFSEEDGMKAAKLEERFAELDGWNAESDAATLLNDLGIDSSLHEKLMKEIDAKDKVKVLLAQALFGNPDVLLLDEPTNDLDIKTIDWLQEFLINFDNTVLVVSHDRYFLDRMSNKILDLDNGSGKVYSTNYTGFLEEKQRDFEKQMANYKDQQALIKKLEAEKKYFAERGMATNSSTLTARAHTLQTKIDRLKAMAVARPKEQKKLNVGFNEERKSSKKVITAEGLTVATPDGRKILDDIDLEVCAGERVAFIGSNGSGKSTFIKSILGEQELPVKGDVTIGPSVKVGYLPQIINFPNDEQQVLDYFRGETGVSEQKARQILAGFEFYKEDVTKRVKNLSGGERMKVKLAELLQQKINTLIFDEPTNHIDIPTKEVLEDAIEDFDGTLIFVSHDRYFINKFADKTVEFKDGKVTTYLGNYEDYKRSKEKEKNKQDSFSERLKVTPNQMAKQKNNVSNNKKKRQSRDDDWER